MFRYFWTISLIFFSVFFINAQNYYAKNYTVQEGLPNNAIRTIFKDKDGYMWIGTDAGVSKFNGKEFINYSTADGLEGDKIWSIEQDKEGSMWFACYGNGISKLQNGKFSNYNKANGLLNVGVRKLYFSEKHNCMLAGTDNSLTVFYNDTIVNFDGNRYGGVYSKNKKMQVLDFIETDSFIYIFTYAGGTTYKFYPETKQLKKIKEKSIPVSGAFITSNNDTIISYFRDGIKVFKKDTSVIYKNIGQVFDYAEDNNKNIWFASWAYADMKEPGGIYKYNGKECVNFTKKFGIDARMFFSVFYDNENKILWVGTVRKGLFMIPEKSFEYIKLKNKDLKINKLYIDKEDKIWLATNKGIFVIKNNKLIKSIDKDFFLKYKIEFEKYSIINKNFANKEFNIFSFFTDFDNNIFATSNIGLFKFSQKAKFIKHYNISADYRNHFIFKNKTKFIKAGWDYHFLFSYKNNEIKRKKNLYKSFGKDPSKFILRNDTIWETTITHGLNLFANDTIINFNKNNSEIKTNKLTDICFDQNNNLITSSANNRVYIYKYIADSLQLLKTIDKNNGIIGNSIQWIACNKSNSLFVSTNSGLNVIDLNLFYKNDTIITDFFDNNEGLGGTYNKSPVFDKDDNLYFVSENKIVKFIKPNKTIKQKQIKITNFKLNFKDTLLSEIEHYNKRLVFKYYENNFEFDYDVLNFVNPEKDLFSYRLFPYQKEWTNFKNKRKAIFMNMPSGNYKLEIKSKNINTNKFAKTYILEFKILKPWWNTVWFYIASVLFLVSIIWFVFYMRFRKVNFEKKKQIKINKQIAEMEMKALQSQMNPHFVFNAITAIQNYVLGNEVDKANDYLGHFSRLLRITLNNASEKNITINEEIEYLNHYVSLERLRFQNTFDVNFIIDKNINKQEVLIPPMLLQPLIENAIKHGNVHKIKNGKINIEIKNINNEILFCSVADNGIGIEQSKKNKKDKVHISKGMQIITDRIKLLNTTFEAEKYYIEVISNTKGTKVNLYLPFINVSSI